ncbi:hypothetical protein GQ42DRAFT_157794 [Ramicandelaber brevisporus]|nr:hypothetical protein GQ42DRAFT_157794 [Ramicandelaber brevisporus]
MKLTILACVALLSYASTAKAIAIPPAFSSSTAAYAAAAAPAAYVASPPPALPQTPQPPQVLPATTSLAAYAATSPPILFSSSSSSSSSTFSPSSTSTFTPNIAQTTAGSTTFITVTVSQTATRISSVSVLGVQTSTSTPTPSTQTLTQVATATVTVSTAQTPMYVATPPPPPAMYQATMPVDPVAVNPSGDPAASLIAPPTSTAPASTFLPFVNAREMAITIPSSLTQAAAASASAATAAAMAAAASIQAAAQAAYGSQTYSTPMNPAPTVIRPSPTASPLPSQSPSVPTSPTPSPMPSIPIPGTGAGPSYSSALPNYASKLPGVAGNGVGTIGSPIAGPPGIPPWIRVPQVPGNGGNGGSGGSGGNVGNVGNVGSGGSIGGGGSSGGDVSIGPIGIPAGPVSPGMMSGNGVGNNGSNTGGSGSNGGLGGSSLGASGSSNGADMAGGSQPGMQPGFGNASPISMSTAVGASHPFVSWGNPTPLATPTRTLFGATEAGSGDLISPLTGTRTGTAATPATATSPMMTTTHTERVTVVSPTVIPGSTVVLQPDRPGLFGVLTDLLIGAPTQAFKVSGAVSATPTKTKAGESGLTPTGGAAAAAAAPSPTGIAGMIDKFMHMVPGLVPPSPPVTVPAAASSSPPAAQESVSSSMDGMDMSGGSNGSDADDSSDTATPLPGIPVPKKGRGLEHPLTTAAQVHTNTVKESRPAPTSATSSGIVNLPVQAVAAAAVARTLVSSAASAVPQHPETTVLSPGNANPASGVMDMVGKATPPMDEGPTGAATAVMDQVASTGMSGLHLARSTSPQPLADDETSMVSSNEEPQQDSQSQSQSQEQPIPTPAVLRRRDLRDQYRQRVQRWVLLS